MNERAHFYTLYREELVLQSFIICQQKKYMTENVASLRDLKVATPPCAAKADIPCGLAARKRF